MGHGAAVGGVDVRGLFGWDGRMDYPPELETTPWETLGTLADLMLERLPATEWRPDFGRAGSAEGKEPEAHYLACWRQAYAQSQHAIDLAVEGFLETGTWGTLLESELFFARWMVQNVRRFVLLHVTEMWLEWPRSTTIFPLLGCADGTLLKPSMAWLVQIWWPRRGLKDAATREAQIAVARMMEA